MASSHLLRNEHGVFHKNRIFLSGFFDPAETCAGSSKPDVRFLRLGVCLLSLGSTHLLSGWPKKSPNFTFATKMVFPKSLKFMNSGSESNKQVNVDPGFVHPSY